MTDRLPGAAGHARGGGPALLEREPVVDVLLGAVATAATGHGCAALLTGEAGIGKTSVVRALRPSLDHGVRVLAGGCDDLLTPRALGPLRDAARGHGRPAARRALAPSGDRDAVLAALLPSSRAAADGARRRGPALGRRRHAGRAAATSRRRIADLPALLVLTYRDDDGRRRPSRCAGCSARSPGRPVHRLRAARRSPGRRGRRWRPGAARDSQRRCTRSPAATRSSSPRCSPRAGAGCRPPSWTPCSRGSAGSSPPRARRSSSWRWCPRPSSSALAHRPARRPVGRAGRGRGARRREVARRTASRSGTSWPAAPSSRACRRCAGARCNRAVVAALRDERGARPAAARAPRRAGRRRATRSWPYAPGRRARGGRRRLAPPGARALGGRTAARPAAGRRRARAPARRARAGSCTTRTGSRGAPSPSRERRSRCRRDSAERVRARRGPGARSRGTAT